MKKTIIPVCLIMALASLLCFIVLNESMSKRREATLSRISQKKEQTSESQKDEFNNGQDNETNGSSDRLTLTDTVILMKKNIANNELVFRNIEGGSDKALLFDAVTSFNSRRGMPLTTAELEVGAVYDVTFTTFDSKISMLSESDKVFSNVNINKFSINEKQHIIKVGNELYQLNKDVVVGSNEEVCELMDITSLDTLTLFGRDKEVISIVVDSGHGYIRVKNDSYFVGGWIEIGQEMIKVLTEDMLIPVPEGSYKIKVSNKGYVGHDEIDVERDKETILDLSKIEIEEVSIGHIKFDIVPEYALLFVDGLLTDFEERVPLEYGIHSIRVESAGYDTINTNIKVGSEYADIKIELEEENSGNSDDTDEEDSKNSNEPESASSSSSSSSSSSTNSLSANSIISDSKKIFVEGPVGASVYLDGTYIGIAPCFTNKIIGNHTVTLSRAGFVTKSYTINVSNDNNDITLSFSELQADL